MRWRDGCLQALLGDLNGVVIRSITACLRDYQKEVISCSAPDHKWGGKGSGHVLEEKTPKPQSLLTQLEPARPRAPTVYPGRSEQQRDS